MPNPTAFSTITIAEPNLHNDNLFDDDAFPINENHQFIFQLVEAALSGNNYDVTLLVNEKPVNLRYRNMSAAFVVGQKANQAAGRLLLSHNANINDLAAGAASKGHQAYAMQLHSQGACIEEITIGAAFGGHFKNATQCIQAGGSYESLIYGAALGGYITYAEKQWRAHHERDNIDFGRVIIGAAFSGHLDYCDQQLRQDPSQAVSIAMGAAYGGHHEYTERMRSRNEVDIDSIALGALMGGHTDYAEELVLYGGARIDLTHSNPHDVGILHQVNHLLQQRIRELAPQLSPLQNINYDLEQSRTAKTKIERCLERLQISEEALECYSSHIPTAFMCPISTALMRDPVVAADTHSYDRLPITTWLESHHTSPLTNLVLPHKCVTSSHTLTMMIIDYLTVNRSAIQSAPSAPTLRSSTTTAEPA